jgi:hypothetical protein
MSSMMIWMMVMVLYIKLELIPQNATPLIILQVKQKVNADLN